MTKADAAKKALDRAAAQEEKRLARARLAELRQHVRAALAAKKERMRGVQEMCRMRRKELRDRLRAMRAEGLAEIRALLRNERQAARAALVKQKRQARQTCDSAVALVRAEIAAERQHQAEERRIAREHKERLRAHKKGRPEADAELRAKLGALAPILDQAKRPIRPASGESRTEAVLKYVETHPEEAHAILHPHAERDLAETKAALKEATRQANGRPKAKSPAEATSPASTIPNDYEFKRAQKLEKMRARAQKMRTEAQGAYAHARAIGDAIPMGQPILVGHHSQRRHERDVDRMRKGYSKASTLSNEAARLERRATRAEKNPSISSDDPDAISKLRAKLDALIADRKRMRAANAAIRAGGGNVLAKLAALGFREDQARKLLERDFAGRIGFADYAFRNASQEARRLQQRIAELEKRANVPPPAAEQIGSAHIFEADNRVRVEFPSVPPEATRRALKSAGFRWAPSVGAWQRHASNAAWVAARHIVSGSTP